MKKALSLVLAIVMVLSLSVVAMAWESAPSVGGAITTGLHQRSTNSADAAFDVTTLHTAQFPALTNLSVQTIPALPAGVQARVVLGVAGATVTGGEDPTGTFWATRPLTATLEIQSSSNAVIDDGTIFRANLPANLRVRDAATAGSAVTHVEFTATADIAVWANDTTDPGPGPTPPPGATTATIPNTWTIDGLSATGAVRIEATLAPFFDLTGAGASGDAGGIARFGLRPDDFTWRLPRQGTSGHDEGLEWAEVVLHGSNTIRPAAQQVGTASGANSTLLRSSHFNRASLRTTSTTGMNGTIHDVGFHFNNSTNTTNQAAIRIRTVEFMTRTGSNDVAFDLSLAVTGQSTVRLGRLAFNVENNKIEVYNDREFIDPSKVEYIEAMETVRNVEIYAGEGVTFHRNITRDQRLYVQAELATMDGFEELFRQHADLVDAIRIHTSTGWNAAAVTASIERADTLFVWNEQRNLIGTTADKNLPFSNVYFLTTTQNIPGFGGNAETPAPEAPGGDVDNENLGGDGPSAPNTNFNPGTGR